MARTIYKVEEGSRGKTPASPEPLSALGEWQPTAPLKIKRRRLIYILAGIIFLTIIMIVIIAALGASESPAVGTVMSSQTVTSVAVPVPASEPVGTSTTAGAVQQAAVTPAALPAAPSSTVSSAQTTSTT